MSEDCEELELLAFRYVAGEMAADEAAAFEARLADDQPAREAVSRAVELGERLIEAAPRQAPLVTPLRVPPAQRETLLAIARPLGWMAAGAAAALLAVSLGRPPADPEIQPTPPKRAYTDAVVWARLHAEQDWVTTDLERYADESASMPEVRDAPDSAAVPSWVFAGKSKSDK
jgi:hypothetical protein